MMKVGDIGGSASLACPPYRPYDCAWCGLRMRTWRRNQDDKQITEEIQIAVAMNVAAALHIHTHSHTRIRVICLFIRFSVVFTFAS